MTANLIVKFKILGKAWKLKVLSKKKYKKKNGSDSLAVSKGWKRTIELSPQGHDLETIVHELVHGFLYELCCKGVVEYSVEGLEEVYAELLAKWGLDLITLAKTLHRRVALVTKPSDVKRTKVKKPAPTRYKAQI